MADTHPQIPFPRKGFARIALLAVLLSGLLAFLPGQASIPPIDRDEARFAQASKQMVESGDLVTVRYQQELRAKKPVGIYWMQAASAGLFGIDAIAAYRLPSLVGALAVALAGFWFARQLLPAEQAAAAGLFMASSLVLAAEAHLAKTDAMLCAAVLVQQIALWRIYCHGRSGDYVSGRLALLFWGAMGFAILIKGPIAPLVAVLTAAALAAWTRSFKWLHLFRPVIGFIVLSVMVLPWVILVTHATDGAFLATAIQGDLVSKLKSGQESHGAPPLTHLALLVATFWPGSLLLARGAIMAWRKRREAAVAFLLAWVVPFWIVIELTPTKLPHYFLPVMPGLAMLLALGTGYSLPAAGAAAAAEKPSRARRWLSKIRSQRTLVLCWEAVFVLASVGLGVGVLYGATVLEGSRALGFAALGLSAAVAGLALWWTVSGRNTVLVLVALAACGFHATVFGGVLPSLESMHLAPRIEEAVRKLNGPVESIAVAGYHEPSMVFALGTDTLLFSAPETALFLAEAPNGLAIVESRARSEFIATAARAGIAVRMEGVVRGYNISRGDTVALEFYRTAN